jgi:hypothetical protein
MWLFPMSKTSNLMQLAKDFGNPLLVGFYWELKFVNRNYPEIHREFWHWGCLYLDSAPQLISIKRRWIVPLKELLDRYINFKNCSIAYWSRDAPIEFITWKGIESSGGNGKGLTNACWYKGMEIIAREIQVWDRRDNRELPLKLIGAKV